MILVARLREHGTSDLSSATRADLTAMITRSDNAAAIRQYHAVCSNRIIALARRAGMDDFTAPSGCNWGSNYFSAIDQAKLMHRIDALMPRRHRSFGMTLLRSVTASQRWGVAAAADTKSRWRIAFKGGWLPQPCGQIEHQVALFTSTGERARWSLAVLSECGPGSSYGHDTEYGIAQRLL